MIKFVRDATCLPQLVDYVVSPRGFMCLTTGSWHTYDSVIGGPDFFVGPNWISLNGPSVKE